MKIHAITIDCADPQTLAGWWSEALGLPVTNDVGVIVQLAADPDLPQFQFQKIADVPTQSNRVHADLKTPDLDAETKRLTALGATVVQKYELPNFRYTTLTDPDGNKFDLIQE